MGAVLLEVEHVQCVPLAGEKAVVRMRGRWLSGEPQEETQTILLIEEDGRRHRFPPIPQPRRPRAGAPGTWQEAFAIPGWLAEHLEENATLTAGDRIVPLPAVSDTPPPPLTPDFGEGGGSASAAPTDPAAAAALSATVGDGSAETVAALRGELASVSEEVGRLRGLLTEAQAELEAQSANQTGLDVTQTELRGQLQELRALLDLEQAERTTLRSERDQLRSEAAALRVELSAARSELASVVVDRDSAAGEAAGLRAELERLGDDLAEAREALGYRDGGLAEAEALLEEARALTHGLRGE